MIVMSLIVCILSAMSCKIVGHYINHFCLSCFYIFIVFHDSILHCLVTCSTVNHFTHYTVGTTLVDRHIL